MITPKKLDSKVIDILNNRIGSEYKAHYFYRHLSNYFEDMGYTKAAKYFAGEASEELEHAEGLQKYLADWNVTATLKAINPPDKVTGLVDAIEAAYELEYDLFEDYRDDSTTIFNMGDIATFDFLAKYRAIQTESVAKYATLINKLELIDNTDKNWVANFEHENF